MGVLARLALLLLGVQLSLAMSVVHEEQKYLVGDMELNGEQWESLHSRKMMPKSGFWPADEFGSINVPWRIEDPNVPRALLEKAIDTLTMTSCVMFTELPKSDTKTKSYLRVHTNSQCQAGLGYNPTDSTSVSIEGHACDYVGVLHELGHALGMNHEQSRSDREGSIIIVKENIGPGNEAQFKGAKTNNYGVPYDYLSAMHYGEGAGAVPGKRVMLTKDPRFQNLIGQGKDLSFGDLKTLNLAYGCLKSFLEICGKKTNPCKNDGYLGIDCICICPLGTSGDNCETKKLSYNDALIEKYAKDSKIYTKPATVSTPGFPKGQDKENKVVHAFQAGKCEKAVVTFVEFQLEKRQESSGDCVFDSLEIRDDITVAEGPKHCAVELKGKTFKSKNQMLILHFTNYDYASQKQTNPNKGYQLKFTTEKIPNCK